MGCLVNGLASSTPAGQRSPPGRRPTGPSRLDLHPRHRPVHRGWAGAGGVRDWVVGVAPGIGAAASSVVVLAMTERGAAAMLKPNVQVGVDATLALGPVGAGIEGGTANLSADLVAFARSRGFYGGVSLQGAVLGARTAWNHA